MSILHLGNSAKKALTWVLAGTAVLTFGARLYTQFYYLNMPRSPEPITGRIYPAGAAYNTLVYVSSREFKWVTFLNTPMMSIAVACVLLLCWMWIDPHKRTSA
jgi:hypothetical protein